MTPIREYLMIGKLLALLGAIALICWQSSQIHKWHEHSLGLSATLERINDAAKQGSKDGNRISKQLKDKNNEDNRRIAGDANSLRVSGPGAAICRPAPAAPSGHIAVTAKPDAAGPTLPPADGADLSAVPWPWLVQRSEEHDQLLAEVQAWRTWHDEVLKVWPKSK
jgi:hypothetical protein